MTTKEENFKPVRDPQSFDTSINGKNVSYMTIVEPKPRGAHLQINRVYHVSTFSSHPVKWARYVLTSTAQLFV